MMKMFRTDISKQVSTGSSPPTLVSDCVSRAIRAEYWINQDKEARAQIFKAKKEEKAVVKQMQPRQNTESSPKGQNNNPAQSSKQFGRNKRNGNFMGQGQQRNYPQKMNNRGNKGNSTNFPICAKCGRKHPGVCRMGMNACYLCGKEGHYARSYTLNNQNQNPPYPSRNANSQLHAVQARIEGPSITELFVDLIAIKLQDFDVILGMNFLGKYNVKIDCRKRCVTFNPYGEEEFSFYGQSRSSATRLVSAMKAWKMIIVLSDSPIQSAGNHQVASRK
ncbi:hypothetical protein TIFTF001_044280 [Ficus carica]|uniref:CCHC-type domain-containing protein n=1 Tax=Ficus carica TaxID=3494 RepID=A0AA88CT84_FICCA|nr:hypothetical protein TIFTF001_044271 [Ficus carica]GMN28797.1 hypothetical protein TIFTF001_044274 [Ficus carica]GMN28814.1 hypothetical protein TIFTF001_044277 [Ficus carica]GMN28842.1 hypothetical protein TIFTF001_044280 [Ficus carica]